MSALEPEGSPKYWPPLGLPVGSVRAILTLFVVAIVTVSVARGHDLDGNSADRAGSLLYLTTICFTASGSAQEDSGRGAD